MHSCFKIKMNYTVLLCGFIMIGSFTQRVSGQEKFTPEPVQRHITTTGAMIRSAILPGWGQWYNGYKMKSILVFGVEAGLSAGAVVQNQRYVEARYAENRDVTAMEFYSDSRGQLLWYMGAGYLLNILDAFVDAYLWDFNTGDNLSLLPMVDDFQTRGVTLSLKF